MPTGGEVAGQQRGVEQLRRRFLEKHQGWTLLTNEGVEVCRQACVALFVDVPTDEGDARGEAPVARLRAATRVSHQLRGMTLSARSAGTLQATLSMASSSDRGGPESIGPAGGNV